MIGNWPDLVNGNDRLIHRGRFVNTRFLVQIGETEWLIRIVDGRIIDVREGPFVMPAWTFALRASAETWQAFWATDPKPGWHDLFALLKYRRLKVEGDMHPFMSNLFYFKDIFSALRGKQQ